MSRATKTGRELSIPGAPDPQPIDGGVVLVKVQALGAARIVVGHQVIGPTAGMLLSLLLRLIYAPGHAVLRDTLLAELWPKQPAARQRGNLRQALYKLRSYGVRVALVSGLVRFDRRQLDRTLSVERTSELFERDVTRGSDPFGTFLPGYVAPSVAWQRAMEEVREVVHGDLRRVLVEQLRMRRERVDWGGAAVLSRWLLQFDPLNEDATLAMAECTMLSGAKAEAVAILDRYLAELGPHAGDIRLPAALLRRRFTEPPLRRRSSLASTERHFVGREQELADLSLAMRRARWHDGSAVLLHGPPGIGKTRLCAELGKVATIEGYRDVSMDCRETDQQRPLAVILDALPVLLSSPGALGSAPESLSVLRRLVGEEVPEPVDPVEEPLAPTIAEEAGAALSATERYERTMRTVRTQSIRHAIIDLVAAVSDESPIFMVVDDAQWLDDASWDVLTDLIQRVGAMRLFIVLTSRFGTLRAERPARMPEKLVVRRIPGLSDEECVRLARAISEDLSADPTAEVAAWLVRGSEGTPLMLRALVDHWIITGEAMGIPPTLASLLEQRLDRLSPVSLTALHSINLLGRLASLHRIRHTLELPTSELLVALEQLEEVGCLCSNDAALVTAHDMVGRTAEKRMTKLGEATLRSSIARALEQEYIETDDLGLLVEAIVQLEASSSAEVVHRFVCRHERALLESGRPASVLSTIERLQESSPNLRFDKRLRRIQSRLSLEAGEYRRALEVSAGSLSLPQDLGAMSDLEMEQTLSLVDSAYRADPVVDREELSRFVSAVATTQRLPEGIRMRAAEIGLTIAANTCDVVTANSCYHTVFTGKNVSFDELDDQSIRLALLYHAIFGKIEIAEGIATSIINRFDSLERSTTTVIDVGRAAFALRLCGNTELARKGYCTQLDLALKLSAPRLAQYSAWQLSQLALDAGNLGETDSWNRELERLLESDNDPISSSFTTAHLCRCAIEAGDQRRAFELLDEVKSALPRFPTHKSAAYIIALELGSNLISDQWMPSKAIVEVAVERHRLTSRFGTTDYLTSTIADCLARIEGREAAISFIDDYLQSMRRERSIPSASLSRSIHRNRLTD